MRQYHANKHIHIFEMECTQNPGKERITLRSMSVYHLLLIVYTPSGSLSVAIDMAPDSNRYTTNICRQRGERIVRHARATLARKGLIQLSSYLEANALYAVCRSVFYS